MAHTELVLASAHGKFERGLLNTEEYQRIVHTTLQNNSVFHTACNRSVISFGDVDSAIEHARQLQHQNEDEQQQQQQPRLQEQGGERNEEGAGDPSIANSTHEFAPRVVRKAQSGTRAAEFWV